MKLSRISLVLGFTAATMVNSGFAASDDVKQINSVIPGQEKLQQVRGDKTRSDQLYFVRFKDSPVASYQGDIMGYSATNIQASNQKNKTAKGVLDLNSRVSINYGQYLEQQQATITQNLSAKVRRTLTPKHQYQVLLNAIAVELTAAEAAVIAQDNDVENVEKIGLHQLHTSSGPAFIGAKQIWDGSASGVGTQGEGVVVGIIDTGINATHPSFAAQGVDGYQHINPLGENNYLGDCQDYPKYCNDKLIGIVSYPEIVDSRSAIIDDNYDDIEDKVKVGYDFNGHGSHVASTAAGNILHDVNYYLSVTDEQGVITGQSGYVFDDISGVAPHANIVSYQVCDDYGCYPELTVLALEHAIANGVNVINYSVGGSARDPWTSEDSLAFLNARDAGIHVATSAGNSGPDAQTVGSPGNSPWITTVAAYTHDRSFTAKELTGFIGGESTPAALTGKGATQEYTGEVVLAEDFGDALCLEPFEAGTFDGEIVICERGDIARVRKGLNVQLGGAGGLILINTDVDANSTNADNHLIPAIHLDMDNGQTLVDWLATGSDHQVTITASSMVQDPAAGDIAGSFTSRGPNLPYPNIFAPDIAAPGVDIYAANAEDMPYAEEGGHIPYTTMSGTSMSSPHVAGALALLKATHPDWTPAQAQSAMMSTAHQVTYKDDDFDGVTERSDFFDQGAGSLRINDAVNAGLLLDITKQDYLDASPTEDGDPSTLNSTSMVQNLCISFCSWTRTVTATQASSWTAAPEYLNDGFSLEVSPATFSLQAGGSQEITITARANENLADEWVHGYVNLINSDASMSDTHLQATIGFKAGEVIAEVSAKINNVENQVVIEDITSSGSTELQVKGFGLYKSQLFEGSAIGSSNDAERNAPWMHQHTIHTIATTVKPYTKRLVVEIIDSSSPDMDLFVGVDEDGNGIPSALEVFYSLACISGNEDSNERCLIETPPTGNYWIFAHNYRGTVEDEADDVTIRLTHVGYTNEASFDVDAPVAVAQDEEFDVTLTVNGYLDDSESLEPLAENEVYYGLVELGTKANLKRNIGATLVKVEGLAPVEVPVNTAPTVVNPLSNIETELTDSGSVAFTVDLTDVFADAESEELTYSVTGLDSLSINGMTLSGSLTEAGTFEIKVTATDGELSAFSMFTLTVAAAPEVIPPVIEEPTKSSSGGAMGMGWMMLLIMACIRQRKRVQK
ncbi:S8 family serine peptidase [Shewanella sp. UCD-KL21]|uniref:S8 family serine peptidase n=1 Tax=Shewanella sp. UCD-KL21 TaxID=1917164 RepID=UPI0009706140|nr:S8 family serine peptidase [Shewanella sp. UCD-KL21]